MTAQCTHRPVRFRRLDHYAPGPGIAGLLDRAHAAIDLFGLWAARRRRRRTLAQIGALGERVMLDLGFDPDETRAEAAKPFWRE